MRILYHEYGIQLRVEDDHRLILNVLCGRVAEYGVEFQLDELEKERYKADGDAFVKELAAKVRQEPKRYGSRGRFC
jgi:hypothetical protein